MAPRIVHFGPYLGSSVFFKYVMRLMQECVHRDVFCAVRERFDTVISFARSLKAVMGVGIRGMITVSENGAHISCTNP